MRRGLAGAIAVVLVLTGVVAAGAKPVEIGPPGQSPTADFTVTPRALPRTEPAPAALTVNLRYPREKAIPQKEITFTLDRNLALDFRDFPVCRLKNRIYSDRPPYEELCRDAFVGRGKTKIDIEFPEALAPVSEFSDLMVINWGMEKGVQNISVHASISVPVPTEIVMTLEIRRVRDGRYGTRATLKIPKIAGGSGSLTHLRLKFDRKERSRHGDRTDSVVTARCPDGRLQLRVDTLFADDSKYGLFAVRPCTTRN